MRITGRRQPHPTANLVVEAIVLMKTEEYTSQPQCYTCRCRAGCMAVQLLYLVSWCKPWQPTSEHPSDSSHTGRFTALLA